MSRGGIGSASIVLVFAVLGLTIFATISYISALTDQVLIDSEVESVVAFYTADAQAELIVAEILSAEITPEYVNGIEITSYWDWDLIAELVSFAYPVTETRLLYVVIAIGLDSYEIITWRMYNTWEWEADTRLNVWQGGEDDDFRSSW
ncbi:MAG: hypothetical protein FWE05_04615 [Defluviitaleaceae bacterium]|nr:hypothetical protein [Defluviitaleaceae bacterium]